MDLKDKETREKLAKQYLPLMYKITNQWVGKLPLPFTDIMGYAREGFVYSMNTFKEGTSQSFKQYSAWCMRNFILSGSNNEGHIVKFSAYNQKKAKEAGISTFIMQGMNEVDKEDRRFVYFENFERDSDESIWKSLYEYIERNFSSRAVDMFYSTYGIREHKVEKCKDIAARYGLSTASISISNKKIINSLKGNALMMEKLRQLI